MALNSECAKVEKALEGKIEGESLPDARWPPPPPQCPRKQGMLKVLGSDSLINRTRPVHRLSSLTEGTEPETFPRILKAASLLALCFWHC